MRASQNPELSLQTRLAVSSLSQLEATSAAGSMHFFCATSDTLVTLLLEAEWETKAIYYGEKSVALAARSSDDSDASNALVQCEMIIGGNLATKIFDQKELDPGNALDYLVGKVRAAIHAALDLELQPLDITAAQYVVIVNLANAQSGSIAALCKALSYDPGAMSRMIDRLERKCLVRRLQSPVNRRAITLELTDAGFAIYPGLTECVANVLHRLLAGFSQDETKNLKSLLQKLLANT